MNLLIDCLDMNSQILIFQTHSWDIIERKQMDSPIIYCHVWEFRMGISSGVDKVFQIVGSTWLQLVCYNVSYHSVFILEFRVWSLIKV